MTPAVYILKLFVARKADTVVRILNGIEGLADSNQRMCSHMVAQSVLEPIHAVHSNMLRSGMALAERIRRNQLSICTYAVQGICSSRSVTAIIFSQARPRASPISPRTSYTIRRPFTPTSSEAPTAILSDHQKYDCFFIPKW